MGSRRLVLSRHGGSWSMSGRAVQTAAAIAVGLAAVGAATAGSVDATASPVNRRPICNDIGFDVPRY